MLHRWEDAGANSMCTVRRRKSCACEVGLDGVARTVTIGATDTWTHLPPIPAPQTGLPRFSWLSLALLTYAA
jgi:hypothetical protein